MKKARVVIGANFGDEGKGLVTDYLCSKTGPETLVVRFNGGAQAGHTVKTSDGRWHVFGHAGSGSFSGCPTYLSRFFVCNPLVYFRELKALQSKSVEPVVLVDPLTPITTPYDMMINQCIEEARGNMRHGSCGLGFGETIERNLRPAFALTFADLYMPETLRLKLDAIRSTWVAIRLSALGLKDIPDVWKATFESPNVVERFMHDCELFLKKVQCARPGLLRHTRDIVFEGAQGLLLDQDYGWFPHVTRSNTGLKNVAALAEEAGITELQTHYLTRSYMTRHGAGPMPHETPQPVYARIHDPTNITNRFQGSLRFGYLDIDLLARSIAEDMKYCPTSIATDLVLFVGCMDQIDGPAKYIGNGALRTEAPDVFLRDIQDRVGAKSILTSHGRTRGDVRASRDYDRSDWNAAARTPADLHFLEQSRLLSQRQTVTG